MFTLRLHSCRFRILALVLSTLDVWSFRVPFLFPVPCPVHSLGQNLLENSTDVEKMGKKDKKIYNIPVYLALPDVTVKNQISNVLLSFIVNTGKWEKLSYYPPVLTLYTFT